MEDEPNINEETRHTLLVVDDSEDVHRLLHVRLRQENIDLISALDGETAIAVATEERPSIILLDLDMPTMDGFEVLRRLKDDASTREIPVLVLSGLHSPADKVAAFELGAVDYVTKPFDLMELRVRLRAVLKMSDLIEMLGQLAHVDGLTGLWNRAHFDDRFNAAVSENARHGRPLCTALFDLDHFKSINDTYGHPAGDAALQGFAKLVKRLVRANDIACRYGGEEFALIMPDTTAENAIIICDRIRDELKQLNWPAHPERQITVSVGITGTDGASDVSPKQRLEDTDKALYRAKKEGRDRVVGMDLVSGSVVQHSKAA